MKMVEIKGLIIYHISSHVYILNRHAVIQMIQHAINTVRVAHDVGAYGTVLTFFCSF